MWDNCRPGADPTKPRHRRDAIARELARLILALVGTFNPLNDAEAFAVEQHVLGKLTETGEISPVCLSPIREALISFALITGEC